MNNQEQMTNTDTQKQTSETENNYPAYEDKDNKYVVDSFERENLSYPSLLVEDMLMTLMREFGVTTVRFETLFDICCHCLNFIFKIMPDKLTLDYLLEYMGTSLPEELCMGDHAILNGAISIIQEQKVPLQQRAEMFMQIRPLFAGAIIEELQLCDCIDKTYATDSEEFSTPQNYFFYIKNLTRKMTAGKYRFGILNYVKSSIFTDDYNNVSIKVRHVSSDCKFFRFEIIDHNKSNNKIKGECELVGLLISLIITKYFLKQNNFEVVLEEIFNLIENSYNSNKE